MKHHEPYGNSKVSFLKKQKNISRDVCFCVKYNFKYNCVKSRSNIEIKCTTYSNL